MGFKISGGTPPDFTQYVFPDAGTTVVAAPAADGLIQYSKEGIVANVSTSVIPTAAQMQYQLRVVQQGDVTVSFSTDAIMDFPQGIWWSLIPTLPAGSTHGMLQYLNDPQSQVTTTRAMKGGSPVTGATYSPTTGILTYDSSQITDVYMEADYSTGTVSTIAELESAIASANAGDTIWLENGTYTPTGQAIGVNVDNLTIRSVSDDPTLCILDGGAESFAAGGVGVQKIFYQNSDNLTVRGVTMKRVSQHLIQMTTQDGLTLQNCILQDAYEQFLKGSQPGPNSNGLVENCTFEFTVPTPNFYTGGIDCHHPLNWTVRDNVFRNFTSPGGQETEWAIHFWNNQGGIGGNLTIERNQIIDCDRGIGVGVSAGQGLDQGGVIKNNFISRINDGRAFPDHGISINDCPNFKVYNNTIYLADSENAIDFRYNAAGYECVNNLVNTVINTRDGAVISVNQTNLTSATSSWFVDAVNGDLHIDTSNSTAVAATRDTGTSLASVIADYDGDNRPYQNTAGWDIGADEIPLVAALDPSELTNAFGWMWAGESAANISNYVSLGGGRTHYRNCVNLVSPGTNDFYNNNSTGDADGYLPCTQPSYSRNGYSTLFPTIACDVFDGAASDTQVYGQHMFQADLNASGAFYLGAVVANNRGAGIRYLWGTTTSDYVKMNQEVGNQKFLIKLSGGSEIALTADGAFDRYTQFFVEIWRDADNSLHCAINGAEVTSGSPSSSALCNINGWGGPDGDTSAGWDDWLFEVFLCDGATTPTERNAMRLYVDDKWGMV